jgi:excisionase family DNA binding protein
MAERWLTTKEAAAMWRVSPRTIRRWVNAQRIEGCKFGPKCIRVLTVEGGGADGVQEGSHQEVAVDACR